MTDQITVNSHAKINWLLRVGPPRPDGYHDICSIMQTLALADEITVSRRADDECHLLGFPLDIEPAKNLAYLAWMAMRQRFPDCIGGVDIAINKILPRGGGLGGGSSNAAAVIQALHSLFQVPTQDTNINELLRSVAATIGSDIPFFIPGGVALVTGRGEHVQELAIKPRYPLVLLFPQESMPTPQAYRQLDAIPNRDTNFPNSPQLKTFLTILASENPAQLAPEIQNDFERIAAQYDWFLYAQNTLNRTGALCAILCGSGSTVAGLCADEPTARRIANEIGGFYTHTISA